MMYLSLLASLTSLVVIALACASMGASLLATAFIMGLFTLATNLA